MTVTCHISAALLGCLAGTNKFLGFVTASFYAKLCKDTSQRQVNKSSDIYRDPSRYFQGSRRTLLKEMTRGNWIGRAGKSTHFPSPHTCALGLIHGPMALLYGATTHWN